MLILGAVVKLSTCASKAPTVAWLSVVRVAELNWFSCDGCLFRAVHSSTRPSVAYAVVADSKRVDDVVPCP